MTAPRVLTEAELADAEAVINTPCSCKIIDGILLLCDSCNALPVTALRLLHSLRVARAALREYLRHHCGEGAPLGDCCLCDDARTALGGP